ncbi:uncharacterized protein LOC143008402 isoform X2 [Genypterus blacodes]|uniref:uncharacterized protein LOC143008402 isoform X2 n=1 Tax=Genypterus blacodes TaxID=154954 RepID=UPI003F75E756
MKQKVLMFLRHTIVRVCNCNSTNRLETLFSKEPRHISQHLEPPVRGQKYNGLVNQGSTCYLNSVLQVLYMTDDFREAVDRHAKENPDTECVDGQLKTLFDDLKQHDAYTYLITKKLGIQRVLEQRDAAEYYEKILSLTSAEASQLFHGQLTHRFRCVCGAETNTHDAFWSLPLALTDSTSYDYNVVQGIKEFFRDTEVKGENQLYCDTCDAKADATVKCEMKHHPEVLMLLLKRFEFDYQYMRYVKINCCVDVPRILQIPKLHKNQAYELYAIVDHCGDLRSGHYTATIQSQEDKTWYKFNDADVRPNFQPFQEKMTERSTSAYLLFYKKVHEDIIQEPSLVVSPQDTRHKYEEIEKSKEITDMEIEVVDKEAGVEGMITDPTGRKSGRIGDDEEGRGRERLDAGQKTQNEEGVTCTTHGSQDVHLETRGGDEAGDDEGRLMKKLKEDEEQKGGDKEDDDLSTEVTGIPVVQGEEDGKEDKKQKRGHNEDDDLRTEVLKIPVVQGEEDGKEDKKLKRGHNEDDDLRTEVLKIPVVQGEEDGKEDKKQKRGHNEDVQRTGTRNIPGVPSESEYRRTEDQGVDCRQQVRPCVPKSRSDKPCAEYIYPIKDVEPARSPDVRQREKERKYERSNEERKQVRHGDYDKPVSVDIQGDQERTMVDTKAVKTADVHEQKTETQHDLYKRTEHRENQQNEGVRQTKEERMTEHGKGDKMGMKGDNKHTENREMRKDQAVTGQPGMGGRRGGRESQGSERGGSMKPCDRGQMLEDDQQDAKSRSESVKGGQKKSDTKHKPGKLLVKITEQEDKMTPTGIQRTYKESVREISVKAPPSNKTESKVETKHNLEHRRLTEDVRKLKLHDDDSLDRVGKRSLKRAHEGREASESAVEKRAAVEDHANNTSCFPVRSLFQSRKGMKKKKTKRERGSSLLGCFPSKQGQTSESE